jgi:hypothetical protein
MVTNLILTVINKNAMKNIKQISILFFISILLFSCKNENQQKEEYFEEEIKPKLVEKYKCYGVDDCLSKYEFQGAREFASETAKFGYDDEANMNKIITSESTYWINEKEYDRAYKIIKEYEPARTYEDYLKSQKEFKVLDNIISSLISDKEFDNALLWALKASDIKATDGSNPGIDSFSKDHGPSQQKMLLKKIATAKKMLSKK